MSNKVTALVTGAILFFGSHAMAAIESQGEAASLAMLDISGLQEKAQAGGAIAQYLLGGKYMQGDGVPKDDAVAVKLFAASAAQGLLPAKSVLASMFLAGQGVEQSDVIAYSLSLETAQKGDPQSQFMVGMLKFSGRGTTKDDVGAYAWMSTAAANGHGQAAQFADAIRQSLSASQVKEAEAMKLTLGASQ